MAVFINDDFSEVKRLLCDYDIKINSKSDNIITISDTKSIHVNSDTIYVNLENHHVLDVDKEDVQIINISQDGLVECNHSYISGDIIRFENIELAINEFTSDVINELNKEWQITVINSKLFKLEKFNMKSFTFINGSCVYIKQKTIINQNYTDHNNYNIHTINKSIQSSYIAFEIFKLVNHIYTPIKKLKLNFYDITDINFSDKNIMVICSTNTPIVNLDFITANYIYCSDISNLDLNNIHAIINTTNDIKITKFLDAKCFQYNIPLFDFTIDNYRISTHTVIPYITNTSTLESLYQEKSYPMCVTTSFPNQDNHVIAWAREQFEKLKYNDNPIQYAYNLFCEYFDTGITKLLNSVEPDIWKNGKKKPTKIVFDINNNDHINFIISTINIFTNNISKDQIIEKMCKTEQTINYTDQIIFFDKNNNHHIEWLLFASKLRCLNYNIKEACIDKIKYTCNINQIPTISFSLAINMCLVEIIKYFTNDNNYKNTFINLIDQTILETTNPVKELDIAGIKMNLWDKLEYKQDTTLNEFKNYYEKKFNITINMIADDKKLIYSDFMSSENLNMKLSELITTNTLLYISSDNDIIIPDIQVLF